jgi:hypothetical protein
MKAILKKMIARLPRYDLIVRMIVVLSSLWMIVVLSFFVVIIEFDDSHKSFQEQQGQQQRRNHAISRLHRGMTHAEVEAILGETPCTHGHGRVVEYYYPREGITVIFSDDGLVVEVYQDNQDGEEDDQDGEEDGQQQLTGKVS